MTQQSSATLNVALLQLASHGWHQDANLAKGLNACRRAKRLGADIALFPEMWNIGCAFERPAEAAELPAALARWEAQAIAAESSWVGRFRDLARELDLAIAVTYLERVPGGARDAPAGARDAPGGVRDTVSLIDRHGRTALTYAKVHTCAFDEPEAHLLPGEDFPVVELDTAVGPVRVGAMICFDREFPEAARVLMLGGAELILVPNACELEDNRLAQIRTRAFENMVAIAVANYPSPEQNGRSVAHTPIAFDAQERSLDTLVVEAEEEEEIVLARFDLAAIREWRRREVWGAAYRRPQTYSPLTEVDAPDGESPRP
ncbi:MAG TPA: carbon-nitrogen hydrolase family protein [Thermoleophilia bacterium]|nr:carbon-nitrogen hydrolase family protein [Thermoleophilia bacterium]